MDTSATTGGKATSIVLNRGEKIIGNLFFTFFFKQNSLKKRNHEDPHSIPPAFYNKSLKFHTGFAVGSFNAAAFYMNRWLYDQEYCLPSGLVYSDMPHIRDVQISLICSHNIPLNQLMFV